MWLEWIPPNLLKPKVVFEPNAPLVNGKSSYCLSRFPEAPDRMVVILATTWSRAIQSFSVAVKSMSSEGTLPIHSEFFNERGGRYPWLSLEWQVEQSFACWMVPSVATWQPEGWSKYLSHNNWICGVWVSSEWFSSRGTRLNLSNSTAKSTGSTKCSDLTLVNWAQATQVWRATWSCCVAWRNAHLTFSKCSSDRRGGQAVEGKGVPGDKSMGGVSEFNGKFYWHNNVRVCLNIM